MCMYVNDTGRDRNKHGEKIRREASPEFLCLNPVSRAIGIRHGCAFLSLSRTGKHAHRAYTVRNTQC